MSTVLQELQTTARGLYAEALQAAQRDASTGGGGDHGGGGKGTGSRERQLFDARDYKIPDLPAAPSMAVFKKWRHDFELFLETIGSSWKGVTAVLRASRLYEQTFEKDQLGEVEALSAKHEPKAPTLDYSFDFDLKTDALYKLLMPRLPVALATEFRQVGQTNGFELYRRLVQKLDPPRADASFHLSNEIRGL